MFNFKSNVQSSPMEKWNPPKNSAVQIAATITAQARIYMYQFVSREDCYYTDTDSVVLGSPLPDDWISSTVLGKLKLEDRLEKGIFLAPKSYSYSKRDSKDPDIIKYRGAGKSHVSKEWFEAQYENPELVIEKDIFSHFKVNTKDLSISTRKSKTTLGVSLNNKRIPLFLLPVQEQDRDFREFRNVYGIYGHHISSDIDDFEGNSSKTLIYKGPLEEYVAKTGACIMPIKTTIGDLDRNGNRQSQDVLISTSWTEGSIWIGSKPKFVNDLTSLDVKGQKVVQYMQENLYHLKINYSN